MSEKLYTIPVNEAFDIDCECPFCQMRKSLEENAIEFTMGPSYMEDDVRGVTSRMGFCEKHTKLLYLNQNRLGMAFILKSQMDKIIKDIEKHAAINNRIITPSFLKKKGDNSEIVTYLDKLEHSCYVCNMIEGTFERYMATAFHLYHTDIGFREKFQNSKGFCTSHYKTLYSLSPKYLGGEELKKFIHLLNTLYIENMKRVRDDLEWFIDKFDYRYADEPWKNAKDALPRAMQKTNSIVN
ncbi:MAG TPA: DUF6062 family protein [Mobilitalea sp.]|nr:DUF6062 family protein [Mobilitalea sp.]